MRPGEPRSDRWASRLTAAFTLAATPSLVLAFAAFVAAQTLVSSAAIAG